MKIFSIYELILFLLAFQGILSLRPHTLQYEWEYTKATTLFEKDKENSIVLIN